jgi:catechol 2,3-dioxygenase-like lactoylglutathione lyase family enzyme
MLGPMAGVARLDHCVIHVSDWDVSNAFYGDVLGAEVVRVGERWAYRFGEQQLNVHGPGVEVTEVARLPVEPGNSDLCFEWAGPIEDAVAHLRSFGVAVEAGPVERSGARGSGRSVYFPRPGRQPARVHLLPPLSRASDSLFRRSS